MLLCTAVGICILFVLFSGCLDSLTNDFSGGGGGNSGSCGAGSHIYTTSYGHCCPDGYPYYYADTCHSQNVSGSTTCPAGYAVYTTSQGHCCPSGYTHYYDGSCHPCAQGYYHYDTSAGYCCPEGYPYYYGGTCHSQSSGTNAAPQNNVQVDARTGCPATYDLQCSGWISGTSCQIQSCTCYWSAINGDTTAAYYHTSDNAYFPCTGAGQTINCMAAAEAAAQHCG